MIDLIIIITVTNKKLTAADQPVTINQYIIMIKYQKNLKDDFQMIVILINMST